MPGPVPTLAAFGTPELLIILFVALLLFGATKLPKLARAAGSSVSEFKKGMREGEEELSKPKPQETTEAKK